jgi:hypothetical protein
VLSHLNRRHRSFKLRNGFRRESQRGGVLFGLLLSAMAVMCLLFVGGIYLASNIRVHTTERAGGADVSIDTPGGHLTVRAHEKAGAAATGVPLYPGARSIKESHGGDAVVEWSSSNGRDDHGFSVSATEMVTTDSLGQVVDYYKGQLPNWLVVQESRGGTRIELAEGGYKRIVAIHERHDGTHIAVASVGEPASN